MRELGGFSTRGGLVGQTTRLPISDSPTGESLAGRFWEGCDAGRAQERSPLRLLLVLAFTAALSPPTHAQEWNCYAPKPGHPTAEERRSFVSAIAVDAVQAERKHGVPAPAIAAMAITESGYGFTRIALNANNLFGYKWTSAASAGDRGAWELECQPAWDQGKLYIKFDSRADAVDFVAGRLASSKYYRADTDAFKAALLRGDDRTQAIGAWVDGIAAPYNYDPPTYARTLKRVMNNALDPSDTLSPMDNLYRLAATADPTVGETGATVQAAHVAAVAKAQKAAYAMTQATNGCPAPEKDILGWPATVVRECIYTVGPKAQRRTGYVLLVDVKPETIAKWIENACAQVLPNASTCFRTVLSCAAENSGLMFPLSGNMMENMGNKPWKNYFFRNGMTVAIGGQPNGMDEQVPIERQKELALMSDAEITKIPSGLTRFWRTKPRQFAARFPSPAAPQDLMTPEDRQKWLDIARSEFLAALDGPNNRLLEAWIAAHPQTLAVGTCPSDADP